MGGVQTHKRMVASLEKQIAVQEKKLEQVSCLLSPKMKNQNSPYCLHSFLQRTFEECRFSSKQFLRGLLRSFFHMACFLDSGIKGFDCLLGSLHFPNLCIASNDRGESNAMKHFLRFFSASFIKWDHSAEIRCHCPSPSRPGAKIVFPFGVPESEVNTNARRNFYACSHLPFLPLPFLYFLE